MAYYEDLKPCDYFGEQCSAVLKAVGWLDNHHDCATGTVEIDFYERLKLLLNEAWQPSAFCGVHDCELCQFDGVSGYGNLFVPTRDFIFVCPELIVHYISAHHYKPPEEFISAVMSCPDTGSMEYKKLLLQSGGGKLTSKS